MNDIDRVMDRDRLWHRDKVMDIKINSVRLGI